MVHEYLPKTQDTRHKIVQSIKYKVLSGICRSSRPTTHDPRLFAISYLQTSPLLRRGVRGEAH